MLDRDRWSGHSALLGKRNYPSQGVADVLGQFGRRVGEARHRYRRFVAEGILRGRRPAPTLREGAGGQGLGHATVVSLAYKALGVVFAAGFYVRQQMPLALGADSEPEPDIAVVRGTPRDYFDEHPTTALLVIEVSDTTLGFDRGRKAALYAKAGIPEYWILNLVDRVLEVDRDPAPLADRPSEYAYRPAHRFGPADAVTPLSLPNIQVRVADLLP